MDDFLKSYVDKYGQWRKEGDFPISSRVIPVIESLTGQQRIFAAEEVLNILRNAKTFALAACSCRVQYSRCNRPRETCLLVDDAADRMVELNKAHHISLEEAATVLKTADVHGLILMTYYLPGQKVNAICSCCPCCCHDLQLLLTYDRSDLVAPSDYLAITDFTRCTGCGRCVERCIFHARRIDDDTCIFRPEACLGCGLCVSVCPVQATLMQKR